MPHLLRTHYYPSTRWRRLSLSVGHLLLVDDGFLLLFLLESFTPLVGFGPDIAPAKAVAMFGSCCRSKGSAGRSGLEFLLPMFSSAGSSGLFGALLLVAKARH